jgi:cytochrome d ubiquinol oxidase subunit I
VLMILLAFYGTILTLRDKIESSRIYLRVMPWAIALPFIANTTGWIMREIGRQPWIVFGLQKTADGVSPTVSSSMVSTSFIGFTIIYGILAVVLVSLFIRYIKKGTEIYVDGSYEKELNTNTF